MPSQKPDSPCTESSVYCSSISYTHQGVGTVTTYTTSVSNLPLGGTDAFFNLLTSSVWAQNGWTFNKAQSLESLKGRFDIGVYFPFVTPNVGAEIQVLYNPVVGQDPVGTNVHFIQRVVNNHAYVSTLQGVIKQPYGTPENKIDTVIEQTQANFIDTTNPQKQTFNPFYDTYGQTVRYPNQTILFRDYPVRDDIYNNKKWDAELYLVEIKDPLNKPSEVTIYDGISWGWTSVFTPAKTSKTFSGTLTSGYQRDNYNLDGITPGSKYQAWINNDLPSNQCNPNTRLNASSPGSGSLYDDNSSPVGNGFASGLTGTVGNSGILNLAVQPVGGRGEGKGNYELFVNVYNPGESPTFSNGNSGGGGVSKEMRGLTQQNPILPTSVQNGWQTFNKVPGCRWYDPHTTYGFEFQSLEDTLFTEILDFPVGADTEFAVTVGNVLLGTFGAGDSVDFVSLLGGGVSNFKITGIDSLIGSTAETAFPIQLAFDKPEGSFQMRPFSEDDPEEVPEPTTVLAALLALTGLGTIKRIKKRK